MRKESEKRKAGAAGGVSAGGAFGLCRGQRGGRARRSGGGPPGREAREEAKARPKSRAAADGAALRSVGCGRPAGQVIIERQGKRR